MAADELDAVTAASIAPGRDILKFHLDLASDWHRMPLDPEEGPVWAAQLTVTLLPQGGSAATLLEYQLARVQANVAAMEIPALTAAVWIPAPESGYVSCALGFRLADLTAENLEDSVLAELEADRGTVVDGTTYLEVETWRGSIPAGTFIAARNLLSHDDEADDIESWIEERTVFSVFPPGANQSVQLFFSAESIGSIWDMPAQTQAFVSTLAVELEPTS